MTAASSIARLRLWTLVLAPLLLVAACSHLEQEDPGRQARTATGEAAAVEPPPIEPGVAPAPGPYAPGFDADHYQISLSLPDTGSYIEGRTVARIEWIDPSRDTLALDLTGLAVGAVSVDGEDVPFTHDVGKLLIPVPADAGRTFEVAVSYEGTPDDGLIIGQNVHGKYTAFADNWPNRARYWFPSIDHPSDKASVTFSVDLGDGDNRKVIANGQRADEGGEGTWVWSTDVPIPTYTMVIGVAEFVVDLVGEACSKDGCIEVTTWLFPPDQERAAPSFARASEMVAFYNDLIAPFPYEKLAHVQSSTRYGGMENVTAIFYPEEALAEGRNIESTVAHETAHQWFGDAVTESDWHHLWLSEGFATYFGALFFEHADGVEAFRAEMESSRRGYVDSGASARPIVDPDEDDLFQLLNANNYDKGGWVLHMLRSELGDEDFFESIRAYYDRYEHETVLTEDLQCELEAVSGRDLQSFFQQWVFEPGHPQLQVDWSPNAAGADVEIRQVQLEEWPTFSFPLTIEFEAANETHRRTVVVDERIEHIRLPADGPVSSVTIDPDGALLKEIVGLEQRAR